MNIEATVALSVNGKQITPRQLEVLLAIHLEGSKTAAANKLGISVPVVQRYMDSVEKSIGLKLMASTPTGTILTENGLMILEYARMMQFRCESERQLTVSCSPVTQELVMSVLSSTKVKANLSISDDASNLRALKEGLSDIIVLDDPVLLFAAEDFLWTEIGYMDMIHVDKGPSYIRYKYGAQRIAYSYLDSIGVEYTVDAETYLLSDLLESGKSFFIDEYLLLKSGIKIQSSTDRKLLRHSITAVHRHETRDISRILRALQARHLV